MNFTTAPSASFNSDSENLPAAASPEISAFHWLLILGFPLPVAAATTMPELFTTKEKSRAQR